MIEQTKFRPHLPALPAMAVVALLVAGVLGGLLLRQVLVTAPHARSVAAETEIQARHFAAEINHRVTGLRSGVESLAVEAASRLAAGEPRSTLATWVERLAAENPSLTSLQLVDAAEGQVRYSGNYVVLGLVDSASAGEQPRPRAARIDDWALYIASPVAVPGQSGEVLVAEVELSALHRQVTAGQDLEGRLQIIQHVSNQPSAVLLDLGSSTAPADEERVVLTVPDWELRFQAGPALIDRVAPGRWLYYLCLLGLWAGVITAGVWLIQRHGSWQPVLPKQVPPAPESEALVPVTAGDLWQARPQKSGREEQVAEGEHPPLQPEFAEDVFRDYDIRGHAGSEIDSLFARALGRVLGAIAVERAGHQLVVGRDGRLSSPELAEALMEGILSVGCDVIDLGLVPTPVLNFCLNTLEHAGSGVMVTASHNPAADNGFKIVINQHVLSSNEITALRSQMMQADSLPTGEGSRHHYSPLEDYMTAVCHELVEPAGLRVVIDCGNGVAGTVAPTLFRRLGCEVVELYCDVDGTFPNHPPDPTVEANLKALIDEVRAQQADIGLAFDGDGDRLVAVSASGRIVWPDELLMIFARDLLARNPGADIVYDVKSTRRLAQLVNSYGGRPVMWKTGHAHMRNKVHDTRAPIGGEFSGHLFFGDRWHGFDDGLYAGVRLLEVMAMREQGLDDIVATFPEVVATGEIKVPVSDDLKFVAMAALREKASFEGAEVIKLDGLRVEYADGWGLVRASNTSPALTLRFEADNTEALERIQGIFRSQLHHYCPELSVSF